MYLALPDEQFDQAVVFQLPAMVKARTVGGRKIIEVEASREVEDLEGDLITQAALLGSAASFIAKGHIDVDHYSELGSRVGIHDPWSWVIGRPTDVKVLPLGSTSVVADISTVPEKIWDSVQDRWVTLWSDLTANPPIPWYASVYGFPLPDGLQD